ncbi:MAG: class I SAM-dependent methyltransferase [Saprospiraceae bacterium]|nr:class I SAM-dependent methyltransferase [Saprospiraceae bacterium]
MRKQCIREIDWNLEIEKGFDLMSGMGETWDLIDKESKQNHQLIGVDISPAMNIKANERINKYHSLEISIREENVLHNDIDSNSSDYIVSTFGLKTFSDEKLKILAKEVNRILKINGQFAFVEISKPKNKLFIIPYMFYLKFNSLIGKVLWEIQWIIECWEFIAKNLWTAKNSKST